jgi:hypothetical protein
VARAVGLFGSSQIAKWLEPNRDPARANFSMQKIGRKFVV